MRPLTNQTDRDLIMLLKAEDLRAFDELYYRYVPRVIAFAGIYIKDKYQCEEVVQEVIIRIWKNRNHLDETASFKSYLFQSVKHYIFNLFRNKVKEYSLEGEASLLEHYSRNDIEEDIDFSELESKTRELVDKLPDMQKHVFQLSRMDGYNNAEIAEKLNLSKRTVEHHLYLALKTLKKSLASSPLQNSP
jgi:RNA polymerase sigma-70 factor (ECF subfamily)